MSGYVLALAITVATSTTLSEEKSVLGNNDLIHSTLAGVECPADVDGTDLTIEFSRDDGAAWSKVSIDGTPVIVKIADADGNGVHTFAALNPDHHFALGTKFRVRTITAQGADRVFKLVFGNLSVRAS